MGKRGKKKKQNNDMSPIIPEGPVIQIEHLEEMMSEDVFVEKETCEICKFWSAPDRGRDIQELQDPLLVERLTPDIKGVCLRFPNKETIYREHYKWCGEFCNKRRN